MNYETCKENSTTLGWRGKSGIGQLSEEAGEQVKQDPVIPKPSKCETNYATAKTLRPERTMELKRAHV